MLNKTPMYRGKLRRPYRKDENMEGIIDKNNWIYGNLIENGNNPFIVGDVVDTDEDHIMLEYWAPVQLNTLCRRIFTFYQRDGTTGEFKQVDIYDGDIVEWEINGMVYRGVIQSGIDSIGISLPNMISVVEWEHDRGDIKVLGNKFDNKELFNEVSEKTSSN